MTYQDLVQSPGIVVDAINGKPDVSTDAQPGDLVHFRNAQGQAYITTVNDDGTLADPVPATRLPTPAPTGSRVAPGAPLDGAAAYGADGSSPWGKRVDQLSKEYSDLLAQEPSSDDAQAHNLWQGRLNDLKSNYDSAVNYLLRDMTTQGATSAKTDATTKADAAAYLQVVAAGGKPTQAEIAGYNRWHQGGGTDADLNGGGGTQNTLMRNGSYYADPNFSSNIQRYHDAIEQALGPAAADFAVAQARLETANGTEMSTPFNYGNVGNTDSDPTGGGRYNSPEDAAQAWVQFVEGGGPGVDATDARQNRYAQFLIDAGNGASVTQLAQDMQTAGYATDPGYAKKIADIAGQPLPPNFTGGALVGLPSQAKNPDVRNFGTTTNPNWRQYNAATGTWEAVSGAGVGGPVYTKSDLVEINGQYYEPDGNGGYKPSNLPLDQAAAMKAQADAVKAQQDNMPKAELALQQYAQTVNYIYEQLKQGAFGTDPTKAQAQAQAYIGSAQQILNGALQGVTPQELAQRATANAQIGRDLIQERLRDNATLADSLVNSAQNMASKSFSWDGFNPLTYARLLTEQNMGGQANIDLANKLLQGVAPGNTGNPTPIPPGALPAGPLPAVPTLPLPGGSAAPTGPGLATVLANLTPQLASAPSVGSAQAQQAGGTPAVGSAQAQQGQGSPLAHALTAGLTGAAPTSVLANLINPAAPEEPAQPVSGGAMLL